MKVSIVIPTYNEADYIKKCLESIESQTYSLEKVEVIIVDGMSTDKTRSVIGAYSNKSKLNIKIVDNINKTAPYAMNIGISNAKGEVLIRIDGHAFMEEHFIENAIDILKENSDIACVGGKIETISDSEIGKVISYAMMSPFGVGDAKFRYSNEEILVDTLAFGAYRKEIFEKIGMFDEEFVRNQDDEFNYRLIKSGKKILLSPQIKSYYYGRNSIGKLFNQYFQYGYWKVKVAKKHKNITSLRQLVPLVFTSSICSLMLLGLFSTGARYLLMSEVFLYLMCAIYFMKKVDMKKNIKSNILLLKVFFILHFSYGMGYILGIKDFMFLNKKGNLNKISR